MKVTKYLLISSLIVISNCLLSQSAEFLQHWQPQPGYQINHIQANSPCDLYYDVTNHYWPSNVELLNISLSAFQNQSSSFWILVSQQSLSNPFQIEAIPALGFTDAQMNNQISALAYVVPEAGCPCDELYELEQVELIDDNHGNLTLPPVSTTTYYLIKITVTDRVSKVAFRIKPADGDIEIDCSGRRITGGSSTIIEWEDDSNVSILYPNLSCSEALAICGNGELNLQWPSQYLGTVVSFWVRINYQGGGTPAIIISSSASQNYFGPSSTQMVGFNSTLYSPDVGCGNDCNQLGEGLNSNTNGSNWTMPSSWIENPGSFLLYVELEISSPNQELTLSYENINCDYTFPSPEICESCLPQFVPEAGKKFVISAWVRESAAQQSALDFTNSYLQVSFIGSTTSPVVFYPSGQIIDGWQRIEGIIEYPWDAVSIQIDPGVSSGVSYFDDLRFFPYDGSMKSYVYDPIKLRFIAELDERNYATFYEYDEEGKLTRIKKETERGILTIQESKSSNVKKPNNGN